MICSRCGTENPANHGFCSSCGNSLRDASSFSTKPGGAAGAARPANDNDLTVGGIILPPVPAPSIGTLTPPGATPPPSADGVGATTGPWAIGQNAKSADEVDFGPRYRLGRMLGEGGMGAVYKAYDKELDRTVALKLVRPGLADNPMAVQRFKQELLLASKISHKNVLRIHDLGEFGGTRFISMAFIEGEDLHHLLARLGKLPLERAFNIARQLCAGLEAAHNEGVVHRDFKPQNILLDSEEHAYISDFGLSKSFGSDVTGMTRSGEMLGTPRYMAPEQVQGGRIDNRADLYALGLILYEMVTGDIPFQADSTVQLIYKHVHEQPRDPRELNPEIPEWLARVIMKCLEKDPEARYASAMEILEAINTATAPPPSKRKRPKTQVHVTLATPLAGIRAYWKYAAIAVLVVAIALGAFLWRGRSVPAHLPSKSVTVLVADFTNHTGDPVFNGTLEPMMNVALEGASFINAYNRGSARKLAQKLPNGTDKLDEQPARLVAVSEGISAVITGELSRRGENYSLSAIALDAVTGNVLAKAESTAADKDEVLRAVPKLAAPLRQALGDTMPQSVQLEKAGGAFSTASLEAVHEYSRGMEEQFAGNTEEALSSFSRAVKLDPNFARAYSAMSALYGNLGRLQDSEKYIKLAMEHVDRMTEHERYRTRGLYYLTIGNNQKCVEEYSELVKRYPVDNIGHFNLAGCFMQLRNAPKAIETASRAVEIVPKGAVHRLYLAFYSSYGGDFEAGQREARVALQLNPSSEAAYLSLAEAQLGKGEIAQAIQTYEKLQKLSATGASMAISGLADLALYDGHFTAAARSLEQGANADLAAKSLDAAADKFSALAYTSLLMHQNRPALKAAEKALANSQSVKTRFLAARTFVEAGGVAKAMKLATGLASEFYPEPQSYAKLIEGETALKQNNPRKAIQLFTDANKLLDTWISHYDLGRAYLEAGLFVEGDSEFDVCIKRRGEALEVFMDNVPTYGYFPLIYYYQGRIREGLKSPGFKDSYRTYLSIREKAGEDPLLPEIRKRLGQ